MTDSANAVKAAASAAIDTWIRIEVWVHSLHFAPGPFRRLICPSLRHFRQPTTTELEMDMGQTFNPVRPDLPHLVTALPGPRAQAFIERDPRVVSPSYTRCYPLVCARGEGAIIEDVDGNRFLDFNAGIAVVATGIAIRA